MSPFPFQRSRRRYAAIRPDAPVARDAGLEHGPAGDRRTLAWSECLAAPCAEVGEPQGVRAVVVDLVVALDDARCVAYRLDAEPGPGAAALGECVRRGLATDRVDVALRELAKDGTTSRWFPDVESFEEANLETLDRRRAG